MVGATCWDCGKFFASGRGALNNHCYSTNCTECRRCYDRFRNARERLEHEIGQHDYCGDCDREFMNPNNARQHLNSRAHRAESIKCPLCSRAYTTATGVVMHLEAGACPGAQNMSRDKLYRLIRSRDPQGVISKNLIGWTGESQYEATENTWNGWGYECYFCQREFAQLQSLNQHLNSPAHQQAYYHCPKVGCNAEFKTLASCINHLESESCGYMRFDQVQRKAITMMRGGRLIGN